MRNIDEEKKVFSNIFIFDKKYYILEKINIYLLDRRVEYITRGGMKYIMLWASV